MNQHVKTKDRTVASPAGIVLRRFRNARQMSQMALALEAEVSPRHLSFVETGRARASRDVILRLAEVLDMPLRDRNMLLEAAGFARLYRETELSAPEMAHIREVLDFILRQAEPYASTAVDRNWNVVASNMAGMNMLGYFLGEDGLSGDQPLNMARILFDPNGLRPYIVNWREVAHDFLHRLRRDIRFSGDDPESQALLEELLSYPDVPRAWNAIDINAAPRLVIQTTLRKDDLELRLFNTVTTLGTAQDIALQELRIETHYPADSEAEQNYKRVLGQA
jgi:transcriptional regulator with XRE-family HTH domain